MAAPYDAHPLCSRGIRGAAPGSTDKDKALAVGRTAGLAG